MRNISNYVNIKMTGILLSAFVILIIIFKKIVIDNPVFNFNPSESQSTSWEQYLSNRENMNIKKMKQSYEELMKLGMAYAEVKEWSLALENFYYAKSLFPDRIGPRKNLCYSYLMMCQEDWRFCDRGKKELYYAMKYVEPSDIISFEYLSHLVELVKMEDIIEMEEAEALSAIY